MDDFTRAWLNNERRMCGDLVREAARIDANLANLRRMGAILCGAIGLGLMATGLAFVVNALIGG